MILGVPTEGKRMMSEFARQLATAIKAHEPLPKFEETLSLQDAYELQHLVTEIVTPVGSGGIKAGVTAAPVQAYFNLDHALIASLYPVEQNDSGCTLPYIEGRGIECEVAIKVDANGRPKAIAPAIEIVFVKFSDQSDLTAANLVASNLGADAYILGEFQPWSDSFAGLKAELKRGTETVSQADMNDAIGGPESATVWIVGEAKKRGFACGEDTLLMTGACGPLIPAERGDYAMSIDGLGVVEFRVA